MWGRYPYKRQGRAPMGNIRTYAKGQTKIECYNDIVRLEKRGYECISPMKPVENYKSEFTYVPNKGRYKHAGVNGSVEFKALMELKS
jgi:hypothetical protein